MQRPLSLAVLLAATLFIGCGESNRSSPPGPAPAFQPSPKPTGTDAPGPMQANGNQDEPERADPASAAEPATRSSLTSDKPPAEDTPLAEEKIDEEMPAEEKAAAAPAETQDKTSDDVPEAANGGESTSTAKPGKLFRGLANSFARALTRAASRQSAESTQPASSGIEDRPPVPKLSDDPFPDGEPQDEKKSSDNQPNE
ncbi:MAG TPA: hypothetical protein VHC22_20815 [Pirellulales bacterium]|nr:hypothetical protein [Pirellulales bacterium]